MRGSIILVILLTIPMLVFGQKNTLRLGDAYAEDQLYISVSYNQLIGQPSRITKSGFSYGFSGGFIKDVSLNKKGTIAVAAGVGYGYDFFNHELRVDEVAENTIFDSANAVSKNIFTSHNMELPFEFRWRSSTALKYSFWRVYAGVKALYNLKNNFEYIDANATSYQYENVSAYNRWQYGLTMSAGYDAFNVHIFYGMTPLFQKAAINEEVVDSKIIKFGLIFYIL